jgi:hypothetical protein
VQPARSFLSRSRGIRPLTLKIFRKIAAGPGMSGFSISIRSSDSTVRANPSGELSRSMGWTVEVSVQTTFFARVVELGNSFADAGEQIVGRWRPLGAGGRQDRKCDRRCARQHAIQQPAAWAHYIGALYHDSLRSSLN